MSSDLDSFDLFPTRQLIRELASVEDDLGDVSVFNQRENPTAGTSYTLLDVSDGPKTLLTLWGKGYGWRNKSGGTTGNWILTVDGTTSDPYPGLISGNVQDNAGYYEHFNTFGPIRYDSSLKVDWWHNGSGNNVNHFAFILGSGPHSIAVVRDGEPIYMTAENLSEETIEGMGVPSGFKIVRNPEIDHPNPQTRGMWDDDRREVVDHPYWKPFHDKLDEVRRLAKLHSEATVAKKIRGSSRLPGDVGLEWSPNPHGREDPEADAVEWWLKSLEEEAKRLSSLEELI